MKFLKINTSIKTLLFLLVGIIILFFGYPFYIIKCIYTCLTDNVFNIQKYLNFVEDDCVEFILRIKNIVIDLFKK